MKIQKNTFDIVIDIICLIFLIGLIIFVAIAWPNIPDQIPGHYNAMGEVDRIAGKGSLIGLIAISWSMYILMFVIEMFPQTWNTGVKVTKENKARVYRTMKDLLSISKLLIVLIFTYLTIMSALSKPLSPLFLPISLIATFGFIGFYMIKLIRIK